MFCSNCGIELEKSDEFCYNCGTATGMTSIAKKYIAPPGKGLIVLKRDCAYGFAAKMHIEVDYNDIGVLKNKKEIQYIVSYGKHIVAGKIAGGKKNSLNFELTKDNNVIIIDCYLDFKVVGLRGDVKFEILN